MTGNLLVGRRVLVVEDEMLVLMLIEGMLEDLGCRASSASTVEEALDLVAQNTFDAATLDVNLTGSTSLPVAEVLAGLGVPFAFASGYPDPHVLNGFSDRPFSRNPSGKKTSPRCSKGFWFLEGRYRLGKVREITAGSRDGQARRMADEQKRLALDDDQKFPACRAIPKL